MRNMSFLRTTLLMGLLLTFQRSTAQVDFWLNLGLEILSEIAEDDLQAQQFEWLATDIIMAERPDARTYRVDAFTARALEKEELFTASAYLFGITYFDEFNNEVINREMLIAYPKDGWINEHGGIEMSMIQHEWWDEMTWSRLIESYVTLRTPLDISEGMIPMARQIDKEDYTGATNQIATQLLGSTKKTKHYELLETSMPVVDINPTAKGFNYSGRKRIPSIYTALTGDVFQGGSGVPSYTLQSNDFLTEKFDADKTLIAQRYYLGIYSKQRGYAVYIPLNMLYFMSDFLLNRLDDESSFSSIETYGMKDSSIKENWNIGDTGAYNVDRDNWVDCEIIELKAGESSIPDAIRIKYSEEGESKEKWIRPETDKLQWND